MPGSPEMSTTRPSPDFACFQRRIRSSTSSSRPTSGDLPDRRAAKRPTSGLSPRTRQASCGSSKPASCFRPRSSKSNSFPICCLVLAATTRAPGEASACSRAARLGVSPMIDCSWEEPLPIRSPTTTDPLAMPIRASSLTGPRRPIASIARNPARTARSASSSWARG